MTNQWATKLFDGRSGVRAQLGVNVPADDVNGRLRFVASTAALDRYGEVIDPTGWQLGAYRQNPVFQNAHRYGDVLHTLGRATRVEVGPLDSFAAPVLWMEVEFAVKENPVAAIAYRLYKGGFQSESDVDGYLGLEYDVIGVEEATTLTARKYEHIQTCCRSSKVHPTWRPRLYTTANPGGVGHAWYKRRFVEPYREGREEGTRFIPATIADNRFCNPEYHAVLDGLGGWVRRAWRDGDWDIAAGQFFPTFRRAVHVVSDPPARSASMTLNSQLSTLNYFDDSLAREWWAAMDYGFAHYTVVLLACRLEDGRTVVMDERAERMQLPEMHARGIRAMLARHNLRLGDLRRFVAGSDVFSRESTGVSVAKQYARHGVHLRPAFTDRRAGWAEIMQGLGDPDRGIEPQLLFHERCTRLINTLGELVHDPGNPDDVLKVDADENGVGGDDAADALRYLVATKGRRPGFAVG